MLYLFGDCALDPDRRELHRGAELLSVEPQVFDLLALLLRHRDRVVTKDELLEAVWSRRFISSSTLNTRMNAARAAIGDNGEQQSLIRTIPRKGFRFVGAVQERDRSALDAEGATSTERLSDIAGRDETAISLTSPRRLYVGLVLTVITILTLGLLPWPPLQQAAALVSKRSAPEPVTYFDSSKVPLVEDQARRDLAIYESKPGAKAVAISETRRWGMAYGAPDMETAKKDAIAGCRADTTADCRTYAAGMEVVWPKHSWADSTAGSLQVTPLDIPMRVDALLATLVKPSAVEAYLKGQGHKALAVSRGYSSYLYNRSSQTEAARLAWESCSYAAQYSCLLISVGGLLTVRVPTTHRIVDVFLLANEQTMSAEHKQRIGQIYQGSEWRALARGQSGAWYPVARLPSEAAAVRAALAACGKSEQGCRIHAIGDFRVADANPSLQF
jgi:DNA-binding winged helix-turn-helix (wHTH) protein